MFLIDTWTTKMESIDSALSYTSYHTISFFLIIFTWEYSLIWRNILVMCLLGEIKISLSIVFFLLFRLLKIAAGDTVTTKGLLNIINPWLHNYLHTYTMYCMILSAVSNSYLGPLILKPNLYDPHCQPRLCCQCLPHLQHTIQYKIEKNNITTTICTQN